MASAHEHGGPAASGPSLAALIEERGRRDAAAPYLLDARSERRVTYGDLLRSAAGRRDAGASERVGLLVADPLTFARHFLSLISAGYWVSPLDPTAPLLDAPRVRGVAAQRRLSRVFSDREAPPGYDGDWETLTSALQDERPPRATERGGSTSGGVLLGSSGTTGAPKLIALSQAQLLYAAGLVARHHGFDATTRGFNPLPLWHVNAQVVGLLATLVAGGSLVLDDGFHRTDFWSLAAERSVTWINAVPAVIARLAERRLGEVVPASVRFIRSASAPLSPTVLRAFEASTGIPVVETYGMTEAASQICANAVGSPAKAGSVGPAVGVDLRVRSLEPGAGTVVADVVGHVEIRGPSVIRRYDSAGYEDRVDGEGWLRTGDLGYLDEDGYLFLVGRSDDVINRGGEKIFPRDIEELVLALDGVHGAVVVGEPDDVYGQVPALYVELTDGASSDADASRARRVAVCLRDVLTSSLSRSRRPVAVTIVSALPVHGTGKVTRRLLGTDAVTILWRESIA